MAPDVSQLSLFLATSAQVQLVREANYAQWGRGLTLDGYLRRGDLLDVYEHATDGSLTTWVLTPRSTPQTLDFFCSCETFRRHALVRKNTTLTARETFAYGIAAVYCPPHHRNNGYARHMMRLLHYMLASPGLLPPFPAEWGAAPVPPSGAANGQFSALWSDIGPKFYEACGPTPSSLGWKVKSPTTTIWPTDVAPRLSTPVQWLSEQDCIELWQKDAEFLKERLDDFSVDSSITRCMFLPTYGLAAFQLRRCRFFLRAKPNIPVPEKWGVIIPGGSHPTYATWITDIRPLPVAMLVTRIRASSETFPALMSAIMEAAKENQTATVEIWNLEEDLLELAHQLGGTTAHREEHLSSLAWYGPEQVDDVQWLFNEK